MTTAGDEPHRPGFLAGLVIDVGLACSSLLRTRLWTVTVVATWGLVQGTVLALSMSLAVQTLPGWLMRSSGLVSIQGSIPAARAQLAERSRSLSNWAMTGPGTRMLTGDRARTVAAAAVSPGWFEVLGVELALGRDFQAADYRAGATPVVILGRRLWQRQFGQRSDVVGQRLPISGQAPATIIGILQEDVDHPGPTDLWLPLLPSGAASEGSRDVFLVGQLAPAVDLEAARVELAGLLGPPGRAPGVRISIDELELPSRRVMLNLLGKEVLLAAMLLCLGGLGTLSLEFLRRALRRRRETAIALALGASPARILRQTLLEGGLLTLAGSLVSLLAYLLWLQPARRLFELPDYMRGLAAVMPEDLSDVVLYLITFSLPLVVISLPALVRVTGPGLHRMLRESASTHTGGALGRGLLAALLVGQIALGLGLFVIAGGSLVDLFRAHRTEHPVADRVLVLRLPLDTTRLFGDQAAFKTRLLEALARLPGIEAAAVLAPDPSEAALVVSGRPPGVRLPAKGVITAVGGDLLRTLDLPLRRGRMLDAGDHADAPPVAVIDERFARSFFGDEDPVGRLLWFNKVEKPGAWQIVGVVGSFERFGEPTRPTVYLHQQQVDSRALTVMVRTGSDPMALAPMVSATIHQLQPQQSIEAVASLRQVIEDQFHEVGVITALNFGVGLLCLGLSIISLYAATAALVAARRRELALRLAIGASPARILGMMLPGRLALVTLGTLLGVIIAQLLARAFRTEYGGHQPIGPVPVVVAALLVGLPVLVAGVWGPVRRLGRRSPMQDLRHE